MFYLFYNKAMKRGLHFVYPPLEMWDEMFNITFIIVENIMYVCNQKLDEQSRR